jgi:DNA helicase II / ATP-dependent DNA helicase PcrA
MSESFTFRKVEPLAGLNNEQREAVLHHEGPMLVVAGAGSGKTRVLTTRIARLIEHHGVDPRRILSVTFTNNAAGEMRERIGRLLGAEPAGMWSGTFHAVGARLLRQSAALVGRTPNFTIYDEDDSIGVLRRLMEKHKIALKDFPPKMINGAISDAKNQLVEPREYQALAADPLSRNAALVYNDLEGVMRAQNAVSFDDLLVLPVRIMEQHPERLKELQERFQFILVDEYQDTNRAQYRFINLLAGKHTNVMVVGDDDQSIYGWRGADIRNILDFEKDFSAARVVRLEDNYRSSPQILELANSAIVLNTNRRGKTLRATRPGGERVTSVGALDERDEADWVVDEVATRRAGRDSHMLRDFAVLYRTNSQSRPMEEAMRKRNIPYRLIGAVRFYDRREIRDLMAYLKLVANPADNEAFRRAVAVPKRGLGDTTIEALSDAATAAGLPLLAAAGRADLHAGLRPAAKSALAEFSKLLIGLSVKARDAGVDEILRDVIDGVKYVDYLKAEGPEGADRVENVRELVTSAAETVSDEGGEVGLTPLDHFLQRAMLIAGVDHLDPNADAVTMMTLHNAKGLEFPVVFLTGLEDGLFPLAKAFDDPAMLEEERRLFYVGITRAEKKLYLTYAEQRRRNGETMNSRQSQFLAAIPDGMLEYRKTVKARSMGRNFGSGGSYGSGRGFGGDTGDSANRGMGVSSAANRRPGTPVSTFGSAGWGASSFKAPSRPAPREEPEDVSQDAPLFVVGARVKHKKFGSGTIAELSGNGRDAKVRIDFDDEEVGRKTLVIAQANLERGDD